MQFTISLKEHLKARELCEPVNLFSIHQALMIVSKNFHC